ncbi:trimeric intracellular cation channel family protein [Kutzneria sp. CA-103260]|uniref:trimeric intracellular cation channel family protein n=1 Tax=Kutzneria sp. CA-103260 TaxID=2802641 RepID=UPI001BEE98CE|nr:TRIC cation channel family protein [Kutzneria sp. CA-103260]QUQ64438.1 hypothetical protein JJ691_21580 [Kutzneria sp. CA-103260]
MFLDVLQLVAVGVFATSGALAAVRARLDVFGVAVVGTTTALGGGVIRDVMLGVHPPAVLQNWPFLVVSASVSLIVYWLHPHIGWVRQAMLIADAVGLGLFVTSSTADALALGVPRYDAWIIGMTGGIGGGVLRDLVLREVPLVLRRDIYALAALARRCVGGRGGLAARAVRACCGGRVGGRGADPATGHLARLEHTDRRRLASVTVGRRFDAYYPGGGSLASVGGACRRHPPTRDRGPPETPAPDPSRQPASIAPASDSTLRQWQPCPPLLDEARRSAAAPCRRE